MAGPRYAALLARLDATRTLGVALGLERTRAALDRLGNPERRVPAVQIAGTNGKGSVAAMTDAILRAAGLRGGLFTSPHLVRFTERIRIDGREVDGDRLADLYDAVAATNVPLTYYEIGTVLAFLAFAEAGVELMVLETGLGGRLDAATTCHPVATAITSIGFDHAEILGPTLAAIAREKAGIAKSGVPLYLGPLCPEADAAIAEVAAARGAPVLRLHHDFAAAPFPSALPGAHQAANAALAVALARTGAAYLGRPLPPSPAPASAVDPIRDGLRGVVWPGRLERLGDDVLIDCAHNVESAATLADALDRLPRRPRALVISIVAGKAAREMLALLAPRFDVVVLTRSSSPRALTPGELAEALPAAKPRILTVEEPLAALATARQEVGPSGLVVVAGSIFLVGDVRAALTGEPRDPVPTSDPPAIPR